MSDMDTCKHRWKDSPDANERIYCVNCGMTTFPSQDIKRIKELEARLAAVEKLPGKWCKGENWPVDCAADLKAELGASR